MPKAMQRSKHWQPVRTGSRTFGTKYIDTTGKQVLSVAICDRCHFKFPYSELSPDPNFPGLRVCAADADWFDPYRLPARQTEVITLRHPRPDESIALPVSGDEMTQEIEIAPGFTLDVDPAVNGKESGPLTATNVPFNPYEF